MNYNEAKKNTPNVNTIRVFFLPDVPELIYWGSNLKTRTPPKKVQKPERTRNHKLSFEDQLLMVLIRLGVGLREEDLSVLARGSCTQFPEIHRALKFQDGSPRTLAIDNTFLY